MKDELALSATGFGIAVSAFFWIYAPLAFWPAGCATGCAFTGCSPPDLRFGP